MEAGLVFSKCGGHLYWHVPADRSQVLLPDSSSLWDVLWASREILGGFAHTHPWDGPAAPSQTDLTSFVAIESGLGRRLLWPIVTFTDVQFVYWEDAQKDYACRPRVPLQFTLSIPDAELIQRLRELSR